ncbi:MAG TPA: hypothetical protein VE959_12655 [Bryobacteraceae bacterium]|nr:hypothetical protein [Bryobacteraceae bacterium]
MPMEATFQELFTEMRKLQDTLVAVRLTAVEDKPVKGEAALVDHLEDAILEMMGWLDEALKAARMAKKAVGNLTNLHAARRALTVCQERFHRIEQQFAADLVSYEKLRDLASLGSERRGEWLPWSNSVKQGIEQCREPLDGVSHALAACWQEIAERVGMTSVSVTSTNIGQKIVSRLEDGAEMIREAVRDGIT